MQLYSSAKFGPLNTQLCKYMSEKSENNYKSTKYSIECVPYKCLVVNAAGNMLQLKCV